MRQIRYQQISEAIRLRVAGGEFDPSGLLPSEAELGQEYEASRVTIRKALEVLRQDGLLDSRQGFGWMVAVAPVRQPLSALTTIEAQLRASGRQPERRIIEFSFKDAADASLPAVAKLGDRVLEVKRVNLADGEPFARVSVWCRDDLGAELSRKQVAEHSFYELLPIALAGATQTIGAAVVEADDAALLGVPLGSAVLSVERTTFDADGAAVLVAQHIFPAHLTQFVVDLPLEEMIVGE
ncbi:MAG: GntR family transcriptional regulator [Acidimicrobiales bacterium]|nr:GntR family transcriptional regulator [Acidimicrobiales bacterium]